VAQGEGVGSAWLRLKKSMCVHVWHACMHAHYSPVSVGVHAAIPVIPHNNSANCQYRRHTCPWFPSRKWPRREDPSRSAPGFRPTKRSPQWSHNAFEGWVIQRRWGMGTRGSQRPAGLARGQMASFPTPPIARCGIPRFESRHHQPQQKTRRYGIKCTNESGGGACVMWE
jgi:hypothetical protein